MLIGIEETECARDLRNDSRDCSANNAFRSEFLSSRYENLLFRAFSFGFLQFQIVVTVSEMVSSAVLNQV